MEPSYAQLTKELQKKNFAGIYLFYGEEPYFTDLLSDYLTENVLSEPEKEFNLSIVYGRDVTAAMVVNLCRQFPMIGNKQVVVVREAQDIDLKKEDNLLPLLAYAKQQLPSTILVMGFKYKSPPAKLLKLLSAMGSAVVFESRTKKDAALNEWIMEQVNSNGYSLSAKACNMLIEFLGNDLEKISNELGKLYINHPKGKPITEETIEKYIGISKDYNIFELQAALARRDSLKTNQIVYHFNQSPKENSIFKTIPLLFSFFNKVLFIHSLPDKSENSIVAKAKLNYYNKADYMSAYRNYQPAKLQDIISWLRECNARALGIDNYSTTEGDLLRELVFRILH